ncbi:unnamed protein product [Rhodiola kirilowii]
MATLSLLPNLLAATAESNASSAPTSALQSTKLAQVFLPKNSQLMLKTRIRKRHDSNGFSQRVSCSKNNDEIAPQESSLFDRRGMLIGLGGLYGLTGLGSESPSASAAPILPPDISTCGTLELPSNAQALNCCPPKSTTVVDFKLGASNAPLRIRPAAHLADKAYIAKYKKALELMKALPDSDPRSFTQQSNVHCAYCNGGYTQVGFPELDLQVHGSWLFLPFHRYYLYFFERILGSLINDPTFGIPYWNWDAAAGMQIPAMFNETNSVLGKALRNATHKPPSLVDLDYSGTDDGASNQQQISTNYSIMYRQMVSNSKTAKLFHGGEYRAGGEPGGPGSLENYPHGPVHVWCGDSSQPNLEDMGNFYSAGRDPLFYAHHANVDRMWTLWKTLDGGKRKDFTDPDWLNSGFLFYDENKNLVRVKVKDCVDERKLGYAFQQVDVPWIQSKPTPRNIKTASSSGVANAATHGKAAHAATFPLRLNKVIRTQVRRPKKSRTKKEKEDKEEVLVISGIQLDHSNFVKFDVHINDEDEPVRPDNTEYAGSFVNVPHKHKHGKKLKVSLRLGLTDLMEGLDADDDETVVVTLTPRTGCDDVTVGGIKIEFGDD